MRDSREEQIKKLEERLKNLEVQLSAKLKRSDYAYRHGGDGWHDNASWEGLYQDVSVLKLMIRDTKEKLRELRMKKRRT